MPQCDQKNMRLWIEALRSGKYKQRYWDMRHVSETGEVSYCALGVAVAVAKENGTCMHPNSILLGLELIHWFNTGEINPRILVDGDWWRITTLNDVARWSFEKIADALEAFFFPIEVPDDVSSVDAELELACA